MEGGLVGGPSSGGYEKGGAVEWMVEEGVR